MPTVTALFDLVVFLEFLLDLLGLCRSWLGLNPLARMLTKCWMLGYQKLGVYGESGQGQIKREGWEKSRKQRASFLQESMEQGLRLAVF